MVWQKKLTLWRARRRRAAAFRANSGRRLRIETLEARLNLAALTPGDVLVSSSPFDQGSMLYEFSPDGNQVQSVAVMHPTNSSAERTRDIVVDSNGDVQIFNGTFLPRLTTWQPSTNTFSNTQFPNWSTGSNVTYGGIAALNDFVFTTDQVVRSEPATARGIVRFNVDNLASGWTVAADPNIGDTTSNTSQLIPHVTVHGSGDSSPDYYSFTVTAPNSRGIFDIDFGDTGQPGSFQSALRLFDRDGNLLASNNGGSPISAGGAGSTSTSDAFLEYQFADPGSYVVQVGKCCPFDVVPIFASYELQISVENHPLFVPAGNAPLREIEPNDSRATAQNLAFGWTVNSDPNIGDIATNTSQLLPHVTVQATGNDSLDFYAFSVTTPNSRGIFDIDFGDTDQPNGFPSTLRLYDSQGNELAANDGNVLITTGDGGSVKPGDAYLEYQFVKPGNYVIQVGKCCGPVAVPANATYLLQVSIQNHPLSGASGQLSEIEPNDTLPTAENTDSAERFGKTDGDPIDVNVGLDGNLYVLVSADSVTGGGTRVDEYDPLTLLFKRTVNLPTEHRAIAVDQAGHIYAANPGIYHYDANGDLLHSIENPVGGILGDIDIKSGSCKPGVPAINCLAVASNNGAVILTGTTLDNVDFFQTRPSNASTFVAFVTSPLRLPKATDDFYRVAEDSNNNTFNVLINDLVDSRGSFTIVGVGPTSAGGTVTNIGGRSLRYTPAKFFSGQETFTYTVDDGLGSTAQATVTVTVTNINQPPTANDDAFTVTEDTVNNSLDVLTNDNTLPDVGETLTITGVSDIDQGGTVTIENGTTLNYSPAPNFAGTETFKYTISDGNGGVATGTAAVTVTNINDHPTATDDRYNVNPNSVNNTLNVLANDSAAPDTGETLRILSFSTPTRGGSVQLDANNRLIYTPQSQFVGDDAFTYRISDGHGGTAMAKVKVHVAIVNNLPVAQPDTYNVRFDSIGNSLRVLDNDTFAPDVGETLTITDVGVPDSGGVVTIANAGQTLRYSPATGFRGTERFTYTINDSRGGTATADITINVGDFNGPPTADPDAFTLRQNSTNNVLNVLANDFDPDGGDPLSITNLTAPTGGGIAVISLDKGSVIYSTPRPFLGTDTFMYTVSDGHGGSSQALVTITVRGWQNPLNPLDVDRDTHANTATDANIIITELNARTFIAVDGLLPEAPDSPRYFYDTSGDGYLTSLDALLIINALNLQGSGSGGAEGEGASAFVVSALSTNSADAVAPAPSPSAFAASSDLECTLAEIACDVSLARQKRLFGRR